MAEKTDAGETGFVAGGFDQVMLGKPVGNVAKDFKSVVESGADTPAPGEAGADSIVPDSRKGEILEPSFVLNRGKKVQTRESDDWTKGGGAMDEDSGEAGPEDKPKKISVKELAEENERLKAMIAEQEGDVLLGRYVKRDELLMRKVGDSMISGQQQQQQTQTRPLTIEEQLGLDEGFVFIPEQSTVPGTDSYRWLQANIRAQAEAIVDQRRAEEKSQNQINQERAAFLNSGHTLQDLEDLILWVNDLNNFTLPRLWSYKNMGATIQKAVDGAGGASQRRDYVPSIGKDAGGGAEIEAPETGLANQLLGMARKLKNPLA